MTAPRSFLSSLISAAISALYLSSASGTVSLSFSRRFWYSLSTEVVAVAIGRLSFFLANEEVGGDIEGGRGMWGAASGGQIDPRPCFSGHLSEVDPTRGPGLRTAPA